MNYEDIPVYIISLPGHEVNYFNAANSIKTLGFNNINYVPAVDMTHIKFECNGMRAAQFGCLLSHRSCLLNALINKHESVLICEDDLLVNKNVSITDLYRFLSCVPNNWGVLALGYQNMGANVEKVNEYVNKYLDGELWCTHCYMVHSRKYFDLIARFDKFNSPADEALYELNNNVYLPTKSMVHQIAGMSSIDNVKVKEKGLY